jgi:hypothetical protein
MLPHYEIDGLSKRAYRKIPDFKAFLLLALTEYREGRIESKWVKSYKIENHLGLSGSEVRAITSYLRCQKKPTFFVATQGKGYAIAETVDELRQTFEHIDARYNHLGMVRMGLKRMINVMEKNNMINDVQGNVLR